MPAPATVAVGYDIAAGTASLRRRSNQTQEIGMQPGVALPLGDIGGNAATAREFAEIAEAAGYDDLMLADHVLGANVESRPGWGDRNTSKDFFHDPFVLFGFLSGCTTRIGFSTQVLILPQRQTVLVAKQAASLD